LVDLEVLLGSGRPRITTPGVPADKNSLEEWVEAPAEAPEAEAPAVVHVTRSGRVVVAKKKY
jgi:hypothetical protein